MNDWEMTLVWLVAAMLTAVLYRCAETQHARRFGLLSGCRFADEPRPDRLERVGRPPGSGPAAAMMAAAWCPLRRHLLIT